MGAKADRLVGEGRRHRAVQVMSDRGFVPPAMLFAPPQDIERPRQIMPLGDDRRGLRGRQVPIRAHPVGRVLAPRFRQPAPDRVRHQIGIEHPPHHVLVPTDVQHRRGRGGHAAQDLVIQTRQNQIAADRHFGDASPEQAVGQDLGGRFGIEQLTDPAREVCQRPAQARLQRGRGKALPFWGLGGDRQPA